MRLISRLTLARANEIYFEMFNDNISLDYSLAQELVDCDRWADFEALQEEMSAGAWDCIEAAILEKGK